MRFADPVLGVNTRSPLDDISEIASFPDYAASNRPWGSPDLVAARLAEYFDVGVSEIIAAMPAPYDLQTIARLMVEVVPRLRRLTSS